MGIVYLLGDRLKEGFYKIGVTRSSIEKRIKKLQTGNAGEIYLINSFKTEHPYVLEKMLHTKYFSDKSLGEWFELPNEEILKFTETCEKMQKSIDALKDNYFFNKKYNNKNDNLYE